MTKHKIVIQVITSAIRIIVKRCFLRLLNILKVRGELYVEEPTSLGVV